MDKDIVPLCLYNNDQTRSSYIGYPTKKRVKNETKLICEPKPDSRYMTTFYAINPDITTRPPGMDLIHAVNTPNSTIKLDTVYDPFHHQKNVVRFHAWVEPVPHATPLYVWKNGVNIYMSFSPNNPGKGFQQEYFSPIYVLIDPRIKNVQRIAGFSGKNELFGIENGYPQFRFSGYQGRCIPDPNGVSIGECMVLYGKNILVPDEIGKEPTLLNFLDHKYNEKKQVEPFSNIGMTGGLVMILILVIAVTYVVYITN